MLQLNLHLIKTLNNAASFTLLQFDISICDVLDNKILGTEKLFADGNLTSCPLKKVMFSAPVGIQIIPIYIKYKISQKKNCILVQIVQLNNLFSL